MVSDFAWKYESWKFTFWRNESWHFCHHMTPRAGASGKNIKHCQAFHKIVRLAASVLSQFRLQGWPILSTVPYWIWIALWILTTIFHFKYSSIKVTFVTELQRKLFNHQPGLDFFSEQVEGVNCTTPQNFASQRHPSRQNTTHAHCLSWGRPQRHQKGASSLQVSFTLCPPDVTATEPQTSPCSRARTPGSRLWPPKRRWGGHHESPPEALNDKTRFSPKTCWAVLGVCMLSPQPVLQLQIATELFWNTAWDLWGCRYTGVDRTCIPVSFLVKRTRLRCAGKKTPNTQQAETVKSENLFNTHTHKD